jgi:hypothetical protein
MHNNAIDPVIRALLNRIINERPGNGISAGSGRKGDIPGCGRGRNCQCEAQEFGAIGSVRAGTFSGE